MNASDFESKIISHVGFDKPGDDDKFLDLVKSVEGKVDQQIAVILLKTFSDADDHGVQERTRNALQLADKSGYYPALVAELRGLVERSPEKEWGLTLAGMEFDYGDPAKLMEVAHRAPTDQGQYFLNFVSNQEFIDEYPAAQQFLP